ncbi:MAG TPA: hypothetical protein VMB46_01445 [Methanomassiliicoccales archaeon]|nr:hypothetical protein [Methanomassiliicoccales archaeon]
MAEVSEKVREALRRAVESQRRDEPFEKSLGRALRANDLDYDAYISLVSELRDLAKRKKTTLESAAMMLAEQEHGEQK